MPDSHRSDIIFAVLVLILLAAAWHIRDVLMLIYVAALFAVVIGPVVSAIRKLHIGRWHPSRGLSVVMILLGVLFFFGALFFLILPPIVRDLQTFSQDLPTKIHLLTERLQHIPYAQKIATPENLQQYGDNLAGGALGIFKGVAGGVAGFFSWLVLLAYFIIDGERAFDWTLSLFPVKHQVRLRSTLERAEGRVSRWLLGQLMLMLILGVSAGITFHLIGVRYAFALGVFAGLLNIIPIIGPIISVIAAASVAMIDSWQKLVGVLIFYVVYQQIENAFLTPRIMKTTVELPPLAVVIALAIGGSLVGLMGALVAVPTAALFSVLANEYLVHTQTSTGEE